MIPTAWMVIWLAVAAYQAWAFGRSRPGSALWLVAGSGVVLALFSAVLSAVQVFAR